MIISERIFKLLKEKHMSQKQFALQTGITQSSISDWKRKKTNPNAEKIMIICDALEITPMELLQDSPRLGGNENIAYTVVSRGTDEYEAVEAMRKMPPAYKKRLLGYAEALHDRLNEA